ncbi:MAG TPA: two-component regulator propeller domain-containing protein, partial [Flavisolibacter sp.]|nr:two-component regulator propeller domain-containing protein [Flavisolibacter sp.]
MVSKKSVLLFFCVLVMMYAATAQLEDINFTSLTNKDGLSSNTVNAILKDHYGLIWFGTEDGLDKFDGTNFIVYRHKPGDPRSLQSNEISSLFEDKSGNLWIGTSGGSLSLYDRKKDAFINFPSDGQPNSISNNVIRSVCSDYQGKIWIVNFSGVNILDPATKHIS